MIPVGDLFQAEKSGFNFIISQTSPANNAEQNPTMKPIAAWSPNSKPVVSPTSAAKL